MTSRAIGKLFKQSGSYKYFVLTARGEPTTATLTPGALHPYLPRLLTQKQKGGRAAAFFMKGS